MNPPGRRAGSVLVSGRSGLALREEPAAPQRADAMGRGARLLLGLAFLASSLISLGGLALLVRWMAPS